MWVAEQAILGGADVLQLRGKDASTRQLVELAVRLRTVASRHGVPLIVNDRVDVALAAEADGVHLGQEDLPIGLARQVVGPGRILGASTHSLEQALAAANDPTDYIAVGPIHATPTKPAYGQVGLELLREVDRHVIKPIVAIGGLDAATLGAAVEAGARCAAVVRAVCQAQDPRAAAQALRRMLPA